MRRLVVIARVVVLLALAAAAAYVLWPRVLSPEECPAVYRRFADNPHVGAAYIRRFPINDSLTVAVTVLKALDSVGWDEVTVAVGDIPLPPEYRELFAHSTTYFYIPKDSTATKPDTDPLQNNLVVLSHYMTTACIFYTESEEQINAIIAKENLSLTKSLTP